MAAISTTVLWIMAVFAVLGIIERIIKHWAPNSHVPLIDGFGQEMENGFMAMGPLSLAMVGIIAMAPLLAKWLVPVVGPLYTAVGSKTAMFAGTLLAIDMGATPLGLQLAKAAGDPEWVGYFGGLLLGSVFGVNIVFNIPVALGIIQEKDRKYMSLGVLAGIIVAPFGALIQSALAGNPFGASFLYLVPVFIIAALIAAGLFFARDAMIKGFMVFGKFITCFILVGLGLVIFQTQTGVVLVKGMAPTFSLTPDEFGQTAMQGLEVIGAIALALAGAYPLVKFLTTVLAKPLGALGKGLGMDSIGAAGLVATLANNIPMWGMFKDMTPRGKVINAAFQVAAAFTLADHLGFTAANGPQFIGPLIIGKVCAGVLGIVIALIVAPKAEYRD
ncbi:MAG TPA: ethanolamine utilization protein EutH [Spirochaetales bacterium]|nr:ethanolamine utilization protein EutH [Spirochaetales bacterium]HRY53385.1 ethanolamine utilization protein EutH [Spirochaetia bacterium]